jgi:acyl-CoA synthetase (NDP forming)
MTIIRPGESEIDGVPCAESLAALEHKLDLLVVAVAADAVFELVDELIECNAAESVILIPGGLGETQASVAATAAMKARINGAHTRAGGGPIFLGGNCLGVVSHPGGYDSWFIPRERLPKPQKKRRRNSALISQSGAFMISRISKNPWLDPAYMTALGNQSDITHGDMLNYYADNTDIDTIGVYVEGFNDLDGLSFARAVRKAVCNGKQVVVYKAGRTAAGTAAALGHTASEAGDYPLCDSILTQAGAMLASSFSEFDDLFYIADRLHGKTIGGNRLAAVSGAGFETVGMADSIAPFLTMAAVSAATKQRLEDILIAKRLDALMEVRNPIDINPGADDEAHVQCTAAFAEDAEVDAVVVGLDPLSPAMRALAQCSRPNFDIHNENSIVQLLPQLVDAQDTPIIGVVDGGPLYDDMCEQLMDNGVCTFRSCERAVAALARYTESRLRAERIKQAPH